MTPQIESLDPSLEIRKLKPSYVRELATKLGFDDWKDLMSLIPKQLSRDSYNCDITNFNEVKYHSGQIKQIEEASKKESRCCVEILFDEWGTSGRIRPTLGHLLYLLTKAKLYTAADYVAVELLKKERPERDPFGPYAPVDLNTEELEEINRVLGGTNGRNGAIPDVTVLAPEPDVQPNLVQPLVVGRQKLRKIHQAKEVSDMMKFSATNNTVSDMIKFNATTNTVPDIIELSADIIPQISVLLNNESQGDVSSTGSSDYSSSGDTDDYNIPVSDILNKNQSVTNKSDPNIPVLSALNLGNESEPNVPNKSRSNDDISGALPDFSALNVQVNESSGGGSTPGLSSLALAQSSSSNLPPHLLQTNSPNNFINISNSSARYEPLPIFPLKTHLPHVTYEELETKTNNFSMVPYTSDTEIGRLLGLGASSHVFLGLGLFDRPVAVKKIVREKVVKVDDPVTVRFRCEVEVLSEYKHEHLLQLLGYSCDGYTYCLLYEYCPGGSLKERLQATENKLNWKKRLHIALGIARVVSHLHTAKKTPLIHRDIKSGNIMLDANDNPKLGDFGIIKQLPDQRTQKSRTSSGTPAYMAPEAHRGDNSVKLDTYSYGVVLLELLTSLPVLDAAREDGTDLVTYIESKCENNDITPYLDTSVGSWVENEDSFGTELFKIALKCLKEKRKDRITMVEVTNSLENLLNNIIF